VAVEEWLSLNKELFHVFSDPAEEAEYDAYSANGIQ
jgi:hypothetical protein